MEGAVTRAEAVRGASVLPFMNHDIDSVSSLIGEDGTVPYITAAYAGSDPYHLSPHVPEAWAPLYSTDDSY
ncbi:hypothetical protein KIPB_016755, partial [Kipferlia bialata]|eukprot:g16755.t1